MQSLIHDLKPKNFSELVKLEAISHGTNTWLDNGQILFNDGNLLGKLVEMLANSIAEMRTYGESFIIADQAPGLLDMSVIRNTNTKIILRLPELSDRELVGRAANLNDEQIQELARLGLFVCNTAFPFYNSVIGLRWVTIGVTIKKCNKKPRIYAVSSRG